MTDVQYGILQRMRANSAVATGTKGQAWEQGQPHFLAALKSFILVPLFPLAGYCLLDQTGVSHAMVQAGLIPTAILGEGFGHVGLCFSLHYVLDGAKGLMRGVQCVLRA